MNHTLEEIFDKADLTDFDWFGLKRRDFNEVGSISLGIFNREEQRCFSLPDLLANPSWCKAVWVDTNDYDWMVHSKDAFLILQQESEQACLNFIYETIKK